MVARHRTIHELSYKEATQEASTMSVYDICYLRKRRRSDVAIKIRDGAWMWYVDHIIDDKACAYKLSYWHNQIRAPRRMTIYCDDGSGLWGVGR